MSETWTASAPSTADQSLADQPPRVRVLMCDDHRLLSDGLAMLIRLDPHFELLADPFDRAAPAIAMAATEKPDVMLMDFELPGGINGIEATRQITELSPGTKVVVLSGSGSPDELLVKALEAGAAGFLSKTEAASKILSVIQAAASGESLMDARTLSSVLRQVAETRAARRSVDERVGRLTDREREILQRVADGESNDDIARELFLSVHTVHTHVRNLLSKLGFHSKLQAVAWAVKADVVTVRR